MVECLLAGYGDHVAARRDEATLHCAMVGRKRVVLDKQSVATGSPLIVALDVREIAHAGGVRTVLSLASETDLDTLASLFPDRVATDVELRWNADRRAVEQVERWVYDGLTVDETARPAEPGEAAAAMLVDRIEPGEIELPHWNAKVDAWLARTRCVAEWFPQRGLLRYTPDELRVILLEVVAGATRASELRDRPVLPAMRNAMSWEDQQFVERMTPNEIELPSGRPMKIDYEPGSPPKGRAKIQELYGLTDTPRIAGGRQPVLLEILAPNFRPVQMTDDLAGFWKNLYPEVKKELKRRYPKHEWR